MGKVKDTKKQNNLPKENIISLKETLIRNYRSINKTLNYSLSEADKKRVFFNSILNYIIFIIKNPVLKSIIEDAAEEKNTEDMKELSELTATCKEELDQSGTKLLLSIKQIDIHDDAINTFANIYKHYRQDGLKIPFNIPTSYADIECFVSAFEYDLPCEVICVYNLLVQIVCFTRDSLEQLMFPYSDSIDDVDIEPSIHDLDTDNKFMRWLNWLRTYDYDYGADRVNILSPTYPKLLEEYTAFLEKIKNTLKFAWDSLKNVYDTSINKKNIIRQLKTADDRIRKQRFANLSYAMDEIVGGDDIKYPDYKLYSITNYISYVDRVHNLLMKEIQNVLDKNGSPANKENNTTSFDSEKGILTVGDKIIKFRKYSVQYHLLMIIFMHKKELHKDWQFSEIVEEDEPYRLKDEQHKVVKSNEKRYYNACYQVNKKVRKAINKKLFILTNQSFQIDKDLL